MTEIFLITILVVMGFAIIAIVIYIGIKKLFGYDKKEPDVYIPIPDSKIIKDAEKNIKETDKRIEAIKNEKDTDIDNLMDEFKNTKRRN